MDIPSIIFDDGKKIMKMGPRHIDYFQTMVPN